MKNNYQLFFQCGFILLQKSCFSQISKLFYSIGIRYLMLLALYCLSLHSLHTCICQSNNFLPMLLFEIFGLEFFIYNILFIHLDHNGSIY